MTLSPISLALFAGALVGWVAGWALPSVLRALGLERINFQGRPIGTGAGLLLILGGAVGAVVQPALLPLAALLGFGLLGFLDDRWGTSEFKGLRGHLDALRKGRITTGLIKAIGGVLLGLILAWRFDSASSLPFPHSPNPPFVQFAGTLLPSVVRALLIALCANLFNLLDLRPLRTLKAFWVLAFPFVARALGNSELAHTDLTVLAATVGASVPYARLEARRTVMLGDTGANALGGLCGLTLATHLPFSTVVVGVGLLVAFHAWAERNSLSAWIDHHPLARRVDDWGWRKPEST